MLFPRACSLVRPRCSGCPFPSPHRKGAGIGDSGTSPRPRFEGCARQPSGQEATWANLSRKECQGRNEARKPSCPALQIQSSETNLSREEATRGRAVASSSAAQDTFRTRHTGNIRFTNVERAPAIFALLMWREHRQYLHY